MSNFKFISYEPTPSDEKQLGVVTIQAYNKLFLRYKMLKKKEGGGYFAIPASYKVGEEYLPAFVLDSNFEKDEIDRLIRQNVNPFGNSSTVRNSSVPAFQPQSNDDNSDLPF